ncbi:MAG: CYTH domain-containing protein [Chloroflexi bacterium]|nr:CYTH domain-containing protein [Chloroflexota bacterium]
MAQEIERKWLTVAERLPEAVAAASERYTIAQGYLSTDPVVRVRVRDERGFLTIKGPGLLERAEFEYEIPVAEARALLTLCPLPPIEKTRYNVPWGGGLWEVDVFAGANAGLVIAELESAEPPSALPPWAGPEVTSDPRYANSSLAQHPYRDWGGVSGGE